MNEDDKTRAMADDYRQGMTLEEVGRKFGMTRQGIRERFIKAGIERRARDKYESIDKIRLQTLYLDEKLSVQHIASLFSVSATTINLALKFHQIPKRERRKKGGYIVDFLRSLKIDEKGTFELRRKDPEQYANVHQTAKSIGIKISVKALGARKFQITRLQ